MRKPPKVRPLSEFHRNSKAVVREIRRTGEASIWTVNGRAAVVVQDHDAYQRLVDLAEQAILGEQLKKSLDDFRAGKGITLREFEHRMTARLGASSRRKRSA